MGSGDGNGSRRGRVIAWVRCDTSKLKFVRTGENSKMCKRKVGKFVKCKTTFICRARKREMRK